MADFSKLAEQLTAQRAAKAEAVEPKPQASAPQAATPSAPAADPARRPPGRKPSADSKRTGWLARTFYVQPETAIRLKRYVLQCQLQGRGVADQSEAVDEALRQWLDRVESNA
jgi:hypothetical protein